MKTEIIEEDGIFVLRCKESVKELDVFKTREEAEEAQQDGSIDFYCD